MLILAASGVLLALLPADGEHSAEKLLFRAMKSYKKIALNPEVAPPAMLEAVKNDLQKIVNSYPKTRAAKLARVILDRTSLKNKQDE